MCNIKEPDTIPFLIRAAIPEVKSYSSRPKSLPNKSNLLWDSIWRAHRDVLTGSKYLDAYCKKKDVVKYGNRTYEINSITVSLYNIISSGVKNSILYDGEYINPRSVIDYLYEKFNSVEYGAIQKLVNMLFKYLIILKTHNVKEKSIDEIKFNITDCDCPIDSIILNKINYPIKWTSITPQQYDCIQSYIQSKCDNRILYDFKNFQEITIL